MTVIYDPDYAGVLAELEANGEVDGDTRRRLAGRVFARTAAYDGAIATGWPGTKPAIDAC